jgi:hypothetical protein
MQNANSFFSLMPFSKNKDFNFYDQSVLDRKIVVRVSVQNTVLLTKVLKKLGTNDMALKREV